MAKHAAKPTDFFAWPVRLLLWAVLAYIAYDIAQTLLTMRADMDNVNAATSMHNNGRSRTAIDVMLAEQAPALPSVATPVQLLLRKLTGAGGDGSRLRLATMYTTIGHWHNERQEADAAIAAYTLAMLYNPDLLPALAEPLAQNCFLRKQYALGLMVTEQLSPSQRQGMLERMHESFKRRM